MRLDYNLTTAEERSAYINELVLTQPRWSAAELRQMSDYILAPTTKISKRDILTENRLITVNKREVSYQGLSDKLEGGEDALHILFRENKNMILSPKIEITEEDIATIPGLAELRIHIEQLEQNLKAAEGMAKYNLKKQIIELRKEQYTLKNSHRPTLYAKSTNKFLSTILNSEVHLGDEEQVSLLLTHYSKLKQELWENVDADLRWTMIDLDNLIEKYIRTDFPLYYDLIIMKIDGRTNLEIQDELQLKHGRLHSQEYISSLWRNKIPHIIAEGHKEDWLDWVFFHRLPGQYKKCSRCEQIKLAHQRYFSINKSARFGFYSICKRCRNKNKES